MPGLTSDAAGDEGGMHSSLFYAPEGESLLDADAMHRQMVYLHQLLGSNQASSEELVKSIMKDIVDASVYRDSIVASGIEHKDYLSTFDTFLHSVSGTSSD